MKRTSLKRKLTLDPDLFMNLEGSKREERLARKQAQDDAAAGLVTLSVTVEPQREPARGQRRTRHA